MTDPTEPQADVPHVASAEAKGLTRRRALALLAGTGAATALAACSSAASAPGPSPSSASASTSPAASASPSPSPSASHVAAPKAADWRALKQSLHGSVLRPSNHGYDEARILFDRRFDGVHPAAVAQVSSADDIAHCLAFAQRFELPISLRSGGHSYIGASIGPGLVLDLRALSGVAVSSSAGTATIGAGSALVDVYNDLADVGVSIPAGSCASVGLSGLALGGGVGVVARKYGLTCDRLVEASVVTAEGTTHTVNSSTDADLYWALRGGGGSFGVVTSLTLQTHAADPLAHAFLTWPWSAAADVVAAWQTWAVARPSSLWSTVHVLATDASGPPTISVAAVMVASASGLQQNIGELVQSVSTKPTQSFVSSESCAATMLLEAGCSQLSVQQCHVRDETPGGTLPRDAFVAGSDFFRRTIPASGIAALVDAVARRQADPRLGAGGASFDILGGTIDTVADDATAWSHRGALFNAQYTASWGDAGSNQPLGRNQHSLARIHQSVRPYASGEAYQNYADDSLPNPQMAYYGANLPRLIEVRRTYDPHGVFTQPQGVPLT